MVFLEVQKERDSGAKETICLLAIQEEEVPGGVTQAEDEGGDRGWGDSGSWLS